MRKPVYGFELVYEIDEQGTIYNIATGRELKMDAGSSSEQKRFRLLDKKRYDGAFLTIKSFYRDLDLTNKLIIFKNENYYDTSLNNLMVIDKNDFTHLEKYLNMKYYMYGKFKQLEENKHYFISSKGTLISFYSRPKVIKPYLRRDGYLEYKLADNNNELKHFKAHQLVAKYFLPKEDGGQIVNHLDGVKTNNCDTNLEWVSYRENNYHAWKNKLNNYNPPKKCCVVDNKTNLVLTIFESINEGAKYYNVDSSTASKQCRGIKNQFQKGFKFRFWDENKKHYVPTRFD